jgi:hypothetical protein
VWRHLWFWVSLIPDKNAEPLEIAGRPIGKFSALDGHSCGNLPAKLRFVREADMEVKESFFEFMLDPIDDFAAQAAVWVVGLEALGHPLAPPLRLSKAAAGRTVEQS